MSFKYKFTIFTPCYNSEKTLHRVFNSLMSQTIDHSLFEWIVINDASTDNTHELIQEYIKKADFDINYIKLEKNQMLIKNYKLAIEKAQGELFIAIGHDDAFLEDTLEVFLNTWESFTDEEKKKCSGIGVLCQDQFGNRIGNDYPIEKQFVPIEKSVFGWSNKGLGETWAALKTQNLKKYFKIPKEAKNLVYIPESFFWNRIAIESKQYSYYLNKVQRIYYINEGNNISKNIRQKYPEGFLFESKWFVKKYPFMFFKYPKVYIKHLLKVIYYGLKLYKWIKI
jgi:glycosyltransferase involved in cell wall biosynthesis